MSTIKILMLGDVVGNPGRQAIERIVPELKRREGIDFIIANTENAAHGFGITPEIVDQLQTAGVDLCTGGNHSWKNAKGRAFLTTNPEAVIVPANTPHLPGRKQAHRVVNGQSIVVVNLLGQVFMKHPEHINSPFQTIQQLLTDELVSQSIFVIDFHAEATGEKRVLGWKLDGQASLIVGTHTHVQTADDQIQPGGTGYISDLGMCGAVESSLGMRIDYALRKVANHEDIHLEPAIEYQHLMVQGVLATIDGVTKKTLHLQRIDERAQIPL